MAININHTLISGTVMSDPQIVGEGDSKWAFVRVITEYGMKMPDGNYTNVEQPIMVVADVPHHVATIEKYVKKNKALAIYGYIRTWQANGQEHWGVFIRSITFASANWGGDANNTPPLPSQ